MAWTTPRTWVSGEIVTAGNLNAHVRDNVSWIAVDSPACRAWNSAAITTTNVTATAITMDSERFDNAGVHSTVTNTSRFTVPTGGGGKYICTGATSWSTASGAGTYRAAALYVNGTIRIGQINTAPSASHGSDATICAVYALVAADYVELFATQDSGSFLNVNPSPNYSPEASILWFRI